MKKRLSGLGKKKSPKQPSEKTARSHTAKKRRLKYSLSTAILITIVSLGALLFIAASKSVTPEKASQDLHDVLQVNQVKRGQKPVQSKLGMEFSYNPDYVTALGYTLDDSGSYTEYKDYESLSKPEDYAVFAMFVTPTENDSKKFGLESVELRILTNKNEDFFERRKAEHGANLSELELTIKHFAPKDSDTVKNVEKDRVQAKLNGIDYTRIIYEATDSKYFATTKTYEYWYTVQNGRPYVISLDNAGTSHTDLISPLRDIMNTVNYYPPGELPQRQLNNQSSSVQSNDTSAIGSSANIPRELQDGTALKVAARNLPGVVRVGTIRCANITLLMNQQVHSTYLNSCNAAVGSGSIISADGYVSTNGHVALIPVREGLLNRIVTEAEANNPKPLEDYLFFLVDSGVMSLNQLDTLLTDIKNGDKTAEEKFIQSVNLIPDSSLRIESDESRYMVQLSDKPMRLNDDKGVFSFSYDQQNVEAKYIDAEYSPDSIEQISKLQSTSSDVSILKVTGNNFPVVSLGSLEQAAAGNLVTAMGFPAFVDDGFFTKKPKTVASVTQGKVLEIVFDSPEQKRKIAATDTPIAGGNSGGPAFDTSGSQIGLNTYGDGGACGDGKCFSQNSVFRDVADLKNLLSKNKITLNTASETQKTWDQAIQLFSEGKYKKSIPLFEKSLQLYPNNHLASSLIEKARTSKDISGSAFSAANVLKIFFIIGLAGSAAITVMIVRHNRQGPPSYPISAAGPLPYPAPAAGTIASSPPSPPQAPQPYYQQQVPAKPIEPVPIASPQPQIQPTVPPQPTAPQPQPSVPQNIQAPIPQPPQAPAPPMPTQQMPPPNSYQPQIIKPTVQPPASDDLSQLGQ